jgi:hypothetical protein
MVFFQFSGEMFGFDAVFKTFRHPQQVEQAVTVAAKFDEVTSGELTIKSEEHSENIEIYRSDNGRFDQRPERYFFLVALHVGEIDIPFYKSDDHVGEKGR